MRCTSSLARSNCYRFVLHSLYSKRVKMISKLLGGRVTIYTPRRGTILKIYKSDEWFSTLCYTRFNELSDRLLRARRISMRSRTRRHLARQYRTLAMMSTEPKVTSTDPIPPSTPRISTLFSFLAFASSCSSTFSIWRSSVKVKKHRTLKTLYNYMCIMYTRYLFPRIICGKKIVDIILLF